MANILNTLKIIAALGTIATGLFSLIKPLSVRAFTGLEVASSRGITEIRAVLGGFFIALGAAPLLFRNPGMFLMLGFAYFGVAIVRMVSMFLDKSFVTSNYISLATEVVLGIILVL
jgi:hypothetical protein